ncbi:MAG: RNA methyltransferase [Clostridiales bacterium]|nr:RNA methyltransferase [Clostridiales bacterium]
MITSRQNSLIKEIRSLSDKKNRDQLSRYVVEGIKSVDEAFFSGQDILCIVGTERALTKINATCDRIESTTDDVFSSISTEVNPQGVLAVVKKPVIKIEPPKKSCVFLDGVSDPSNVGAIIRTAAASGYTEIYLADSADPFNPKAVRSSMGGLFRIKPYIGSRDELKSLINLPIIIADMDGEDVFNTRIDGDFCLVIGNEANGVSDVMRSLASRTVKIPMENGMESLNAAVSAGIIMYNLKNSR